MRDWQTSPEAKNEFVVEGGVVWIRLTQGKETCIDSTDWGRARTKRWYARRSRNTFYAVTGASKPLHVFLSGKSGLDHEDRNGLNNRRNNLREASDSQNRINSPKRKGCSSRYKGVCFYKPRAKWRARLGVGGSDKHLGDFIHERDAALAYDEAAKAMYGSFAILNFPQ